MRTIFKLSSSVSVPNPIGSPLNKTSYFNGGFIHNYALITNLNDSASSDTMTLARASSKTFLLDALSYSTVTSGNAAFTGSGVLIEPSHTNQLTYSGDISNAAWSKSIVTVTQQSVSTPLSGVTTASELKATTTASPQVLQNVSGSGSRVFSVIAKAGTGTDHLLLIIGDNATTDTKQWFDLTNGTVGTSSTAGVGTTVLKTATITALTDGWYLCSMYVSTTYSTVSNYIRSSNADNAFTCAINDTLFVVQADSQNVAILYSPVITTTAAATSLKDDYTMALDEIPANDFYIEFDWTPLSTAANGDYLLSFTSGSGGNEIFVGAGGNRIESNGGASVTSFTPSVGTTYTIRLTRTSTGGETLSIAGVGSDNEPTATADITWPATGTIGSRYSGGNHSHSVIANVKVGDA